MQRHFSMMAAARMLMKPVAGGTWIEGLATATVPRLLRQQFLNRTHDRVSLAAGIAIA
jgi:hypothetical protein